MSKIESQSIFGHYSQIENRVTAALLQIFKMGGTEFIGRVISQIDDIEFPSSEINVITQEKEEKNVYDGILYCNFSFRILVESKVKNEFINPIQLEGLLRNAQNPYDFILYITPDNCKPKILENNSPKIYWVNWKSINDILKAENNNSEPLNFLIHEFEKYLDFLRLLEVINKDQRVQIVAGSYGEPVGLKYSFYACQNNRTIKECKYLAFYNNGGIHSLFEIVEGPINNIDLSKVDNERVKQYLNEYEPNFKTDYRQYYKLELIRSDLNIENVNKSKTGKNAAYTMGVFRYTTLDKLTNASTTADL